MLPALDTHEPELVTLLADGEANAVAGLKVEGVDLDRRDGDRHLLHGGHAERRDDFVPDEDEVGTGAGHELTLDLVGGGPQNRTPQARR